MFCKIGQAYNKNITKYKKEQRKTQYSKTKNKPELDTESMLKISRMKL